MIQEAIAKLVRGAGLSQEEYHNVANEIMEGNATQAQIGSFITALSIRGEPVEAVTGFVKTMREKATKIKSTDTEVVLDTCGTGGDVSGTFNISTAAAFIAAGAGVRAAGVAAGEGKGDQGGEQESCKDLPGHLLLDHHVPHGAVEHPVDFLVGYKDAVIHGLLVEHVGRSLVTIARVFICFLLQRLPAADEQ